MRRLELALACLVASAAACFIASSDDTVAEDTETGTTTGECPVGTETCPCTPGGACDPGLECRSGLCVAGDGDGDPGDGDPGDGDPSGDGDGDPGDGDPGDGDGDPDPPTACDPLLQDCDGDQLCVPLPSGDPVFACVNRTEDLTLGSSCSYLNDCAPGLTCTLANYVPGCNDDSCCAAFCDLTDPYCAWTGTECTDFGAPAPYVDVGVCILAP